MEPKWNGMAIAGFILAFFCSILGIIFSAIGLNQINQSGGTQKGKGLAIAGLILSIVFFVIGILWRFALRS